MELARDAHTYPTAPAPETPSLSLAELLDKIADEFRDDAARKDGSGMHLSKRTAILEALRCVLRGMVVCIEWCLC